jgi:hypothetical protein
MKLIGLQKSGQTTADMMIAGAPSCAAESMSQSEDKRHCGGKNAN